jgi:hypothetical protein
MQFSISEVKKLRNQLMEVGDKRQGGKFCSLDGSIPPGADEVNDLYERCLKWSDMVLERWYSPSLCERTLTDSFTGKERSQNRGFPRIGRSLTFEMNWRNYP